MDHVLTSASRQLEMLRHATGAPDGLDTSMLVYIWGDDRDTEYAFMLDGKATRAVNARRGHRAAEGLQQNYERYVKNTVFGEVYAVQAAEGYSATDILKAVRDLHGDKDAIENLLWSYSIDHPSRRSHFLPRSFYSAMDEDEE
jgi:hypothetical protein